jgi:hypothetical protein
VIHTEESVAAERERVLRRPPAGAAPPVLAVFTAEVADGFAEDFARRVRDVLAAALEPACTAEFDDRDLPTDGFPEWFTAEPPEAVRTAYAARGAGSPWRLQDWIHRFDPDYDSRGWEFWDIVPVGPSRVRVWVDSWGESFFGSLDLLWLLYTAGAAHVEGPEVRGAGAWVRDLSSVAPTHTYKRRVGPWGLIARIRLDVRPVDVVPGGARRIDDARVWWVPPPGLVPEDEEWMRFGLGLVAGRLDALRYGADAVLVRVPLWELPMLADHQAEVAAAAVIECLEHAYGICGVGVGVTFDRERNRYRFAWGEQGGAAGG